MFVYLCICVFLCFCTSVCERFNTCISIKYTAGNFLAIAQIRPLTGGSLHRAAAQTESRVDFIDTRGVGGEGLARCEHSELEIWNMSTGGISLLVP